MTVQHLQSSKIFPTNHTVCPLSLVAMNGLTIPRNNSLMIMTDASNIHEKAIIVNKLENQHATTYHKLRTDVKQNDFHLHCLHSGVVQVSIFGLESIEWTE